MIRSDRWDRLIKIWQKQVYEMYGPKGYAGRLEPWARTALAHECALIAIQNPFYQHALVNNLQMQFVTADGKVLASSTAPLFGWYMATAHKIWSGPQHVFEGIQTHSRCGKVRRGDRRYIFSHTPHRSKRFCMLCNIYGNFARYGS